MAPKLTRAANWLSCRLSDRRSLLPGAIVISMHMGIGLYCGDDVSGVQI